jgi:hypothetical protein
VSYRTDVLVQGALRAVGSKILEHVVRLSNLAEGREGDGSNSGLHLKICWERYMILVVEEC